MRRFSAPLTSCKAAAVCKVLFSTSRIRLEYDSAEEQEREKQLRSIILQKFRGMPAQEPAYRPYGHFASTSMFSQGDQKSSHDSQTMNNNNGGSGAGAGNGLRGRVDWIMLLTGVLLMYVSGKIMFGNFKSGMEGVSLPLWVASTELQAKHLLYSVQYNKSTRDEHRKSYNAVRQTNALITFFDWLQAQHPEFGSGSRYTQHQAMLMLIGILTSTDSWQLMNLARAVQRSINQKSGDPRSRLDTFLDQVSSSGGGAMAPAPAGIAPFAQNLQPHPLPVAQPTTSTLSPMRPTYDAVNNSIESNASYSGPHASVPFPVNAEADMSHYPPEQRN